MTDESSTPDAGGDHLVEEIGRLEDDARARLAAAATVDELRAVEAEVAGKRSPLTALRKRLGSLDPDDRRTVGKVLHAANEAVAAAVDAAVTIPMEGRTESLNVGMAGTVLCFEALRQRRARAGAHELGNRLDETPPRAAGCTTT